MRPSRLLLPLLAIAAGPLPAIAQRSAFVDVTVVDVVAGRAVPRRTVITDGDRIVRIGPADSVDVPPDAERIVGRGRYLIPGLADLHAHFARPEDFELYLANGVTTVQLLNASADLRPWVDSLAQGRRRGPSIVLCKGPIVGVADSAQAEAVLRDAEAERFGCIKLYDDIAEPAFRALVDGARQRHIRPLGHIPRNLTWEQALAARPSAIAHAEEFLYSPITTAVAVDTIVDEMRAGDIALITTLTNYDRIGRQLVELPELLRQPELAVYSPVHRRAWGPRYNRYTATLDSTRIVNFRRLLAFQYQLVRRLDSAGVAVLAGTDASNDFVIPGFSLHDELDQLVRAGLSPAAALRTATSSAAAALGAAGRAGVVAEGAAADLVLIDGNPLQDITNARLIAGVMRSGHYHTRAELRRWLDSLRTRFAFEQRVIDTVDRAGPAAGVALVERERKRTRRVPIGVFAFNELAWQYARLEKTPHWREALALVEANVRWFPHDPIATGSLEELATEARRAGIRR